MEQIISLITNNSLLSNIIFLGFLITFVILFAKENNNKDSPLNWIDMLLDSKTNKLSLSKFGQFWGIAVSTWIIINISQNEHWKDIFPLIFPAWLTFLIGAYTVNKFAGKTDKKDDEKDYNH